jgi:hypothetical protein
VRGTAHARHALGPEGRLERHRRRRAVRPHQALRERHDAGVLRHADRLELFERLAEPLGRHGEEHEVRARELVVPRPQRADLQLARQLHSGQVVLVAPRRAELGGLLGGPGEQRGANAGAYEEDRNGGAERAGADDGGAARMLSRVANGAKLAAAAGEAVRFPP